MSNKILIIGGVLLMGLSGFAFLRPKATNTVDNQQVSTSQDQTIAQPSVMQEDGTTSQTDVIQKDGTTSWQEEPSPASDNEIEIVVTQKLNKKNVSEIQLGDINYVTQRGKDSLLVFVDGSELLVTSSNQSLLPGNIQVRLDRTYER